MTPDTDRLLSGVRNALAGLVAEATPAAKATLASVDAMLSELLLRTDRGFYVEHHAQGLALAKAGIALASGIEVRAEYEAKLSSLALLPTHPLPTEEIWIYTETLRRLLEGIVRTLSAQREATDWLRQVVDWEGDSLGRYTRLLAAQAPATDERFNRDTVLRYLQLKFPSWKNLIVGEVRVLPGGFSKKTVVLDVSDDVNGTQSLVMRVELLTRFRFWDGDKVANEFPVLQMVHEAGLKVAEPLWLETDSSHFGCPFLVSRKASGQNFGTAMGGDAAPEQIRDVMRHLVAVHATAIDTNDARIRNSHLARWASHQTLTDFTTVWIQHWLDVIRDLQLGASPLVVRLMEWMRLNVPRCDERPSIVHGDFGLHNILFEDGKVSCILDWEYTNIGDPAEDIGLLAISLAGKMTIDEIMSMYRECGGRDISAERLRFFEILWTMKFIMPPANGLKLFQDYPSASVELCKWGFLYPVVGASVLNERIAKADAANAASISNSG